MPLKFIVQQKVTICCCGGGVHALCTLLAGKRATGNGTFHVFANLEIRGSANDLIDIRVTKSTDGGITFPTEINHLRRKVNNQVAQNNDVAFVPINFLARLNKNEIIRLEVENKTDPNDVTAALDSYMSVTRA